MACNFTGACPGRGTLFCDVGPDSDQVVDVADMV